MSDDKNKTDGRDRSKVAGNEGYEVRHFAEHMDIGVNQAQQLIEKFGNDRETLEREAKKLKVCDG